MERNRARIGKYQQYHLSGVAPSLDIALAVADWESVLRYEFSSRSGSRCIRTAAVTPNGIGKSRLNQRSTVPSQMQIVLVRRLPSDKSVVERLENVRTNQAGIKTKR